MKIYVVIVSILIAILFPVILTSSVYFYIALFIVSTSISIIFLVKKEENFLKKILREKFKYKIFRKYSFYDFAIFKITLASF